MDKLYLNNALDGLDLRLAAIDTAFKECDDMDDLCGCVALNVALAKQTVKAIRETLKTGDQQ